MASNAAKVPIFRAVTKCGFSTQTAVKASQNLSRRTEVKTAVLANKLVIASVDNNSPISTVTVLFRAGSRYEQHDSLGNTHILRIAAGLTTKDSTQFGIIRNLQQIGASLSCQTDRETIAYTLHSTSDNLETGLKFLGDVASKQVFKPWELSDNIPRLKYELASLSPYAQLLDLLHRAAYRTGLGNSLFCPDYLVGSHSTESLQHYVKNLFTTNHAAVVGVGVDHGDLLCFAQNLALESGAGQVESASRYSGGDVRRDTAESLAHVAVAVEGTSLKNTKEALAFAVLQYALGVGSYAKWGSSASPLTRAVGSAVGSDPFAVTAFNASYTDSGLFGFVSSSPGNVARQVVEAAVKQLRSGSLPSADIARGKAQLKAAILFNQESNSTLAEDIGTQAVLLGSVLSGPAAVSAVNSITDAEVNAAANKVKSGKLSVAAIGKLAHVPYSDQLT
ncbi:cytochrome b-c1 complex subunit 2, mitochondrial [Zootermopsis nevadensis]|uniref:Cytochrome b-c1 complex subunit 2, mitochondrial n=1 Tax=Zootermopsis nevadensis TaxID=136037 RepID=A0A067RNB5_ZOONE|nr:cytochrome b-c1 complex subunit 2, mitochondrial [Zootermopsis nevadensis]KDR21194.1 Cytochrome b-c1 complex subunit 2, mitochondrial [Zootermopsis nevadensis]